MYTVVHFSGYGASPASAALAADQVAQVWLASQAAHLAHTPPAPGFHRYEMQVPPCPTDPRWVHVTVIVAALTEPAER